MYVRIVRGSQTLKCCTYFITGGKRNVVFCKVVAKGIGGKRKDHFWRQMVTPF